MVCYEKDASCGGLRIEDGTFEWEHDGKADRKGNLKAMEHVLHALSCKFSS